jgi:hypothetical protein
VLGTSSEVIFRGSALGLKLVEGTTDVLQIVLALKVFCKLLRVQLLVDARVLPAKLLCVENLTVSFGRNFRVTLQLDGEEAFILLLKHDLTGILERSRHVAELLIASELLVGLDDHLVGGLDAVNVAAEGRLEDWVANQVVNIYELLAFFVPRKAANGPHVVQTALKARVVALNREAGQSLLQIELLLVSESRWVLE